MIAWVRRKVITGGLGTVFGAIVLGGLAIAMVGPIVLAVAIGASIEQWRGIAVGAIVLWFGILILAGMAYVALVQLLAPKISLTVHREWLATGQRSRKSTDDVPRAVHRLALADSTDILLPRMTGLVATDAPPTTLGVILVSNRVAMSTFSHDDEAIAYTIMWAQEAALVSHVITVSDPQHGIPPTPPLSDTPILFSAGDFHDRYRAYCDDTATAHGVLDPALLAELLDLPRDGMRLVWEDGAVAIGREGTDVTADELDRWLALLKRMHRNSAIVSG